MEPNDYTCLFLPGLPGPQKEYLFLKDVVKGGFNVQWLTYSGTYERKSEALFSLDQSITDITSAITRLEASGKPYFIIAYSYSTYVLRLVDPSLYCNCAAVLMFSPILSLNTKDIGEPFSGLIDHMVSSNDMSAESWINMDMTESEKLSAFSKWLRIHESAHVPAFIFMGDSDLSGVAKGMLGEFETGSGGQRPWPLIYTQRYAEANHKLDSYYNTSARSFIWAVMAIIRLRSVLHVNVTYFLWGSLVNSSRWTYFSDIDLLILGDLEAANYKHIADIKRSFEENSGIHFGVSINRPSDLDRHTFIRQNRAAIFLHELQYDAVSFGTPPQIRSINKSELAIDASTTIAILRAQISKDLLVYYSNPHQITKRIVKAFLQVIRLSRYVSGDDIAVIKTNGMDPEMKTLVEKGIQLKETNYKDSHFETLYRMSLAADSLSVS